MIRVGNVYYMLAYVLPVLKEKGYKQLCAEEFENTAELFAAILSRGISSLLKRGLGREYITRTEALSSLRGKIDVSESIKTLAFLKRQMICTHDDFSENTCMNRIIKSTIIMLMRTDISSKSKRELRKLLAFFTDVELTDLQTVNWNIRYNRNNQVYRMLIVICFLAVKGLLQSRADGTITMMDFLSEKSMHWLYEKFILAYFRREFPQIHANPSHILWQLDDDVHDMLPVMQTDIMLSCGEKILIIDAKYYSQVISERQTLHANNLYQIFAYVKNKEAELSGRPHKVSGMLLYAKTDEDICPANDYSMSGNKISVRTLDLGGDFGLIREQLDGIAERFLSC